MLVRGLPADAAVIRAHTPTWTRQDEVAALTVERLDLWFSLVWTMLWRRWSSRPAPQYESLKIVHPDRPSHEAEQGEPGKGSVAGTTAIFRRMGG